MKKQFPPGTFAPTPVRILAIIQLCIVFSYLFWTGGYPFLGEIYEIKAAKLKYESVLKDPLYMSLNKESKNRIEAGYQDLQEKAESSFQSKLTRSAKLLVIESSLYARLWVLLAIILPILILLKVDGALSCVWMLPLVVSCGFLGSINEKTPISQEEKLFPKEEWLVKNYRRAPLDGTILEQKMQLQEAWDKYLVDVWNNQFFFNVARIEAMQQDEGLLSSTKGVWFWALLWNIGWATGITFSSRKKLKMSSL